MFTGIVEELATVESVEDDRLSVRCSAVSDDLKVSDSICVNGVCLTVVERTDSGFAVQVVPETLARSNLGDLQPGSKVNLERSLRFGGRMGGHFVQGHVDGTARVVEIQEEGNSKRVWLETPPRIMRYMVEKGFIAVDGASLTVVDREDERFSVALIPYTGEHTTLGRLRVGDRVNIEADITAKYVEAFTLPFLKPDVRRAEM